MQDEHFQRQWTHSHDRFSHDIDASFAKLRDVLNAFGTACGPALLRKANATTKAVFVGFISGAALGSALLASAAATPSVQSGAAATAPLRVASARLVLA